MVKICTKHIVLLHMLIVQIVFHKDFKLKHKQVNGPFPLVYLVNLPL